MTIFNLIIICPTAVAQKAMETLKTRGVGKVQQGFIVNKGRAPVKNSM